MPTFKWAEESFLIAEVRQQAWQDCKDPLAVALDAIFNCDACDQKQSVGLISYSPQLWNQAANLIPQHPSIVGTVIYTDISSADSLHPSPIPTLRHIAGPPSNNNKSPLPRTDTLTAYSYASATTYTFATPLTHGYHSTSEALSHTRNLTFLKKLMNGPYFDLEAIWDEHTYYEFEARDVERTMSTMVMEPYVNHVPTMTGGIGRTALTSFYAHHFIFANPADTQLELISRTVGIDRVVDEFIFKFSHDREIPWLLPGVPPTHAWIEVPFTAIVNMRGDRLYHEHIAWDQATVLRQAGLLGEYLAWPRGVAVEGREKEAGEGRLEWEYRVPTAGVDIARKMRDKGCVGSNGMFGFGVREREGLEVFLQVLAELALVMSVLSDSLEPLKVRRARTSGRQHPISARQWKEECLDLFLEPGLQSDLRVLERTSGKRQNGTPRTKSRASTNSTLVTEDDGAQPIGCGKSADVPVKDTTEDEVLTAVEIKNANQLRHILPCAADLVAFQIPQKGSWSCLSVTQDVFDALCIQLDVFPAFRDTVMNMGHRKLETEISPPPLRWQSIAEPDDTWATYSWETCYTLRYIQQNYRPGGRPWSLRQFAVYNKCDLDSNCSSWILVAPPEDVQSEFRDLAGHGYSNMLETGVEMHLSFIDTAVAYFRLYLAYLTTEIDEHNRLIKFADPMDDCLVDLAAEGTRLKLKTLEDDVTDAMLALEANKEVVCALLRMWRCCRVPVGTDEDEFSVVAILADRVRDIDAFIRQLQSLRDKLLTCTQIVSSFSELSNGLSLQRLAETARMEGERTMALTVRAQQDAAAVKALTVVALIYLPSTVVLNFFSTSLIDFPDGKPVLAAQWWLFLVIGGPLTVITVFAWHLWVRTHMLEPHHQASGKWWFWRRERVKDAEKV
ncbi:hypothetical protein OHC33_004715 [Knufia fluminis]|uniref:CorA-like transporter domain-containing protein n=1 Tax=Knufia fluminis TaxID=191047 RepID=A0AAN8ELL7_9EURO|nr:hypothetical protein OHC33_004715 [Knufia fluminis]